IREVCLSKDKESGDGAHQVVVDPEPPHCVVNSRIDPHRSLVGIIAGDLLVHLEEVSVAGLDRLSSLPVDRILEVVVDGNAGRSDPTTFVDDLLGVSRSNVAWDEVSETRVLPLEVIVTLLFGDIPGATVVPLLLRNPDATIVTERFGHKGQ